jgi:hypothetical protein
MPTRRNGEVCHCYNIFRSHIDFLSLDLCSNLLEKCRLQLKSPTRLIDQIDKSLRNTLGSLQKDLRGLGLSAFC